MKIKMLYSKIHRATVTDANLDYVGSITIDEELMEEANLLVGQKVDVVNINNGERFSTYVIKGERGKRDICLNGAAARKVHPGDKIIIIAYASMTPEEAENFKPSVLIVNENNDIIEKNTYLQEG
jgi:aspartate 1-decarboxylase